MKIKLAILYKIIISIAITFLLVYFLLNKIDYKDVIYLFKDVNYYYVFVSFLFYFILTYIRSLRIKLLINNNLNIRSLFAVVLVNNSILNLLPFRVGELSLPLLLKKYANVEKKEGLLLLLYLRIIDTIIILMFSIIVFIFSESIVQFKGVLYKPILLLLFILFLVLFKIDKILLLIIKFIKTNNHHNVLLNNIANSIDKLLLVYEFYKSKLKETLVLSILIFIILIFVLGFVLGAYPIDLSYINVIIISLIIIIITSLPINGIAGIGTVELGISSFLIYSGVNKDLSISIAFNYHFIYLMFIMFFGSLSFIYLHYKRKDII
ncbi:MAG: lysylphosphatidylglycerol synthase transmembrane domain-containing protein [Patescibacteria group bacterium]|nr:lysylphosphatidylglycerol synthase transmembrane domain-containing protein [Patescibacteria group bacterium]